MTDLQKIAQDLLRETGYNASVLKGSGDLGEAYSRAMGLWRDACKLVRNVFDSKEAERMISATWNPEQVVKLTA